MKNSCPQSCPLFLSVPCCAGSLSFYDPDPVLSPAPPIWTTGGACAGLGGIILTPSKREPSVADIVYRLLDD